MQSGTTSEQALRALRDGNARFAAGGPQHPGADAARRRQTAREGQRPIAAVLACSDSRVPPELIFDLGIGDLFVIRVAGNVAGADAVGSAEYAVEHLGVPVLLVLGHTQCGAVTAAVKGEPACGCVAGLLAAIGPAVAAARKKHPGAGADLLVREAAAENVGKSLRDILQASDLVRGVAEKGRVALVGAMYDIESGEVTWLKDGEGKAQQF